MSLDYAILCRTRPEDPASYFLRLGGFESAWESEGSGWDGSVVSVAFDGVDAKNLGAESLARFDALLGHEVGYVIRLNGKAADEDGWEITRALAYEIALDTEGAFVSLDEDEVEEAPTQQECRDSSEAFLTTKAAFTSALSKADALLELVARIVEDGEMTRGAAFVAEALLSRVEEEKDEATLLVFVDALARLVSGLDIVADRVHLALERAKAKLGSDVLASLVEIGERRSAEDARHAAYEWAEQNRPSRVDLAAICTRACAGDEWSLTVLSHWALFEYPGHVDWKLSPADVRERFELTAAFCDAVRKATMLPPKIWNIAKNLMGTSLLESSATMRVLRALLPTEAADGEPALRAEALEKEEQRRIGARFGHDPSNDFI